MNEFKESLKVSKEQLEYEEHKKKDLQKKYIKRSGITQEKG